MAPARASFPALGTTALVVVDDADALPDAERVLRRELDDSIAPAAGSATTPG